jgi:hypothetical protein
MAGVSGLALRSHDLRLLASIPATQGFSVADPIMMVAPTVVAKFFRSSSPAIVYDE